MMHISERVFSARHRRAFYAAIALLLGGMQPTSAHAQGVRFTLSPAAEYHWWDREVGIADGALGGGRVSADFGKLLTLSGYFNTRNNLAVERDSSAARAAGVMQRRRATTDVTTYGFNLAMRLTPGRFAPFASVGAGVLHFAPDSARNVDAIAYRYGGGVHYDPSPNIRAMVMIEDSRFRLGSNALYSSATQTSNAGQAVASAANNALHSSLVMSAGLGIAIGGNVGKADKDADRWSVASVPVEAFAGRLEFNDDLMAKQAVVGVRTGIDVGNYVGLRGFYWQGRSGDLRRKDAMQGYGAESQFNLNASVGPAPFLILGAGRLDYDRDYRDRAGKSRADETVLIVGGGIGIRLSDAFRLNAAARNYVRGPQQVDSLRTLTQLSNNWMYSVGVGYNLGRGRREASDAKDQSAYERANMRRDAEARVTMRRDTVERMTVRRDSSVRLVVRGDTVSRVRMIMLPAPDVGELYVRYGDSTNRAVRLQGQPSRDSVLRSPPSAAPSPSPSSSDSVIRGLIVRIDSLEARLRESEARRAAMPVPAATPSATTPAPMPMPTPTPTPMPLPVAPQPVPPSSAAQPATTPRQISGISPYVGGFGQLVVGAQLDAGPVFGLSRLRFVPDFAIGFGSDPSFSLAGGVQYNFGTLQFDNARAFRPHVRAGLGFLAASGDRRSEFGLNFAYGVTYVGRASDDSRRPQLFVEHQGINAFNTNRFLLGMRFSVR